MYRPLIAPTQDVLCITIGRLVVSLRDSTAKRRTELGGNAFSQVRCSLIALTVVSGPTGNPMRLADTTEDLISKIRHPFAGGCLHTGHFISLPCKICEWNQRDAHLAWSMCSVHGYARSSTMVSWQTTHVSGVSSCISCWLHGG